MANRIVRLQVAVPLVFVVMAGACNASSPTTAGGPPGTGSLRATPRVEPSPSAPTGETPQPVPPGIDASAQYLIGPSGAQPCAFAADGDLLYVTDLRKNKVVSIDTASGLLISRHLVTNAPCAITALDGALFLAERSVKFLFKRDALTIAELADPVQGPGQIWDVDHATDAVWYVDRDNGTAVRVDPETNTVEARVEVGAPASGLAVSPRAIWVASEGTDTTVRIDPATNGVVARITTGDGPLWVAATDDEAWVTHVDGSVVRIDAATNQVTTTIQLAGPLGEPAILGDAVWVPSQGSGTLTELGLAGGEIRRTLMIHAGLAVVFAREDDLWVTGYTDGLVWRVTP